MIQALLAIGICITGVERPLPNSDGVKKFAEELLSAESDLELSRQSVDFFKNKTSNEIRHLAVQDDDSVAIFAAWEEVRRSIPTRGDNERRRINANEVSRFIGFIQGRMHVWPPRQWSKCVEEGEASNPRSLYFAISQNSDIQKFRNGLVHYSGTSLSLEEHDDGLILSSPDFGVMAISDELLAEFVSGDDTAFSIDAVRIGAKTTLFHVYHRRSLRGVVGLYDSSTDRLRWKHETITPTRRLSSGAGPPHNAYAVVTKDAVTIFGIGQHLVYIQRFRIASGERIIRFIGD